MIDEEPVPPTRPEDEQYPIAHWQREVTDGDTMLGYVDWLIVQRSNEPARAVLATEAIRAELPEQDPREGVTTIAVETLPMMVRNLRWDAERYAEARADFYAALDHVARVADERDS